MLSISQLYHKMGKWEGILQSRELCQSRTLLLIQQGRSSLALVSQRSCHLSRNQIAAIPDVCYNWEEVDNFQIKQWLKLPFCTVKPSHSEGLPCSVIPHLTLDGGLGTARIRGTVQKTVSLCRWDTEGAAPSNSALGWWKELPSPPGWILPALLKPQHCSHLKPVKSAMCCLSGKLFKNELPGTVALILSGP